MCNHSKADLTGFTLTLYHLQRDYFSKSCKSFCKHFQTPSKEKATDYSFDTVFFFCPSQLQLLITSVDKPFYQTFSMEIKTDTYFNIGL